MHRLRSDARAEPEDRQPDQARDPDVTATVLIVVNDWLASFQIAAESWYVGNPDLTVAETKRLKRLGEAVDEFLDKVGD